MAEKPTEGFRVFDQGSLQKVLVVGIGNEYRSDDGIGIVIARKICERRLSSVCVKEKSGEGAELMEAWREYERVILVDAVSSGSPPGTLFKINARKKKVPAKFFHYSTHAFSVAEAIELARAMKTLPQKLWVYGIEGANFSAGISISHVVQESIKHVVEEILNRVQIESL
jgi:hydrogenase maturation protease